MANDKVHRAVEAFTKERLNCVQSIFRAFQNEKQIPEERIVAAKSLGGGRADCGRCGALHAALFLTDSEEQKRILCDSFAQQAGSETCREIRKMKKATCAQCVEIAARLLSS